MFLPDCKSRVARIAGWMRPSSIARGVISSRTAPELLVMRANHSTESGANSCWRENVRHRTTIEDENRTDMQELVVRRPGVMNPALGHHPRTLKSQERDQLQCPTLLHAKRTVYPRRAATTDWRAFYSRRIVPRRSDGSPTRRGRCCALHRP